MAKRVVRDDGKRYRTMTEAALALLLEDGLEPDRARANAMASAIGRACRGEGQKTAYGHEWRYADRRSREQLLAEIERLKAEIERLNDENRGLCMKVYGAPF